MGRKVDGKKMNRKQKKFLEDDTEAETQDSKHLDGTQNERGFQINRKASEAHKNDDKINKDVHFVCALTPAWNCPTTPAWRKQKCKQFLYWQLRTDSNSECHL